MHWLNGIFDHRFITNKRQGQWSTKSICLMYEYSERINMAMGECPYEGKFAL